MEGELRTAIRLGERYPLHSRLYVGSVTGDPPIQALLRPGGGLREEGMAGMLMPAVCPVSPSEHYFIRQGPALPGYLKDEGRYRFGLSFEERLYAPLDLPLSIRPYLFGGLGFLGESPESAFNSEGFRANAGLGVRFMILEGIFPLWISDPQEDEEEFEFRWRVRVRPEALTDLLF
jgi:hypothetical protein